MSNAGLPNDPELVHPEQGVELAYSIPQEWGALHVSAAAHEAYGFVPLTANVVEGGLTELSKESTGRRAPRVISLLLAGPGELFDGKDADTYGTGIGVGKKDLGFVLELPETDAVTNVNLMDRFGNSLEGVPEEIRQQEIRQMLIHHGVGVLQTRVQRGISEFWSAQEHRKLLRMLKFHSTTTVAGAAALTTSVYTDVPLVGAGLALSTFGAWSVYKEAKNFVQDRPENEHQAFIIGRHAEQRVLTDFHAAFCISHFEEANQHLDWQSD